MAHVQLITFEIAGEEYGIDINMVSGIVKNKNYKIFKIPNSPHYLEGFINLRGKVNPVFNLKKRFNLSEEAQNEESKIIIVNNGESTLGFLVDEVTDIYKLKDDEIEDAPPSFSGGEHGYIKAIGKVGDKFILMLDLFKVLNETESHQVETAVKQVEAGAKAQMDS